MRNIHIIPALLIAITATSCEALMDTSADVSPSGTVSVGVSTSSSPYYSNVYYNPPYYPNPYYTGPYNNYIPGWIPTSPAPVAPLPPATTPGPVRPGISANWNRPIGNVRPAQSSTPQQPANPSVSLPSSPSQVPDINGSNPGLVTPPQGSGLKLK